MANKKILLVDDDLMILKVTKRVLDATYEVVPISDPLEGVEKAALIKPDAVVADLYMPKLQDGISMCQRLNNDPRTKDIPLVFFCNAKLSEVSSQCESAGALGITMKPYVSELIEVLEEIFSGKRGKEKKK